MLTLHSADWCDGGPQMRSVSMSRSCAVCLFTREPFAFLRDSCRNCNFINIKPSQDSKPEHLLLK